MSSAAGTRPSFGIVIPTRLSSTRLPGKPLRLLAGKTMIQHVYENACEADAEYVVVATEDSEIVDHVKGFGGDVMMTSPDHANGTERVAEVVGQRALPPDAVVVSRRRCTTAMTRVLRHSPRPCATPPKRSIRMS